MNFRNWKLTVTHGEDIEKSFSIKSSDIGVYGEDVVGSVLRFLPSIEQKV